MAKDLEHNIPPLTQKVDELYNRNVDATAECEGSELLLGGMK